MNTQWLNHDFLHEKIPTMLRLYEQEFAEKYEHKNPNASMILNSCEQFAQICQLIQASLMVY